MYQAAVMVVFGHQLYRLFCSQVAWAANSYLLSWRKCDHDTGESWHPHRVAVQDCQSKLLEYSWLLAVIKCCVCSNAI